MTEPVLIHRTPEPYAAIRVRTPMADLSKHADSLPREVAGWIARQGGIPRVFLFKYNVIDMARELDVEMGFTTDKDLTGDERVTAGILAGGRFASITHVGSYEGLYAANSQLIGWARENRIAWDAVPTPDGEAFACRLELYKTGPVEERDPAKWITEVAIKVRE